MIDWRRNIVSVLTNPISGWLIIGHNYNLTIFGFGFSNTHLFCVFPNQLSKMTWKRNRKWLIKHFVENMETYFHALGFYRKIFVKTTFSLNRWFHEIFFKWQRKSCLSHIIIHSPLAVDVGSLPKLYFLISEYQLSTGFFPGHLAFGSDDQQQNRFSPKSWFWRCSNESAFANFVAQSLAYEHNWNAKKTWRFHEWKWITYFAKH